MRSSYLVFVGLSLIGAVIGTSAGNDDPVETAFEDLKEQLCGDKTAPFYVICVSRDNNNPLSTVEIKFLQLIFKKIMHGIDLNLNQKLSKKFEYTFKSRFDSISVSDCIYTKEEGDTEEDAEEREIETFLKANQLYSHLLADYKVRQRMCKSQNSQEHYQTIWNNIKDQKLPLLLEPYQTVWNDIEPRGLSMEEVHSGFVVFQEYFFYGGNKEQRTVVPLDLAKSITEKFSSVDQNMVWMYNFLTREENVHKKDPGSCKKHFTQYQSEDTMNRLRCSSSIKKLKGPFDYILRNQTLYGYKGSIIAGYNKRTYYKENESFLKDVSSCYEFGDGQILTNTDNSNQVFIALRSTAQPYTCADYQYVADDKFTSKKFLVFQSDSYLDPLMIYRENLLLSSSVPRNELNLCHFESSFINNHQCRLGWSIEQINGLILAYVNRIPKVAYHYMIHCDPIIAHRQTQEIYSGSLIQFISGNLSTDQNTLISYIFQNNPRLQNYQLIQAQQTKKVISFKLNDCTYVIELYEVR